MTLTLTPLDKKTTIFEPSPNNPIEEIGIDGFNFKDNKGVKFLYCTTKGLDQRQVQYVETRTDSLVSFFKELALPFISLLKEKFNLPGLLNIELTYEQETEVELDALAPEVKECLIQCGQFTENDLGKGMAYTIKTRLNFGCGSEIGHFTRMTNNNHESHLSHNTVKVSQQNDYGQILTGTFSKTSHGTELYKKNDINQISYKSSSELLKMDNEQPITLLLPLQINDQNTDIISDSPHLEEGPALLEYKPLADKGIWGRMAERLQNGASLLYRAGSRVAEVIKSTVMVTASLAALAILALTALVTAAVVFIAKQIYGLMCDVKEWVFSLFRHG
ncbi:hypothetical protein [Pseudochelatococcus sp. G4_1912]|uniref:hypothetical protein n=1 Tax=Pseudochelatococcus sp. G4_1912 TaxID=3114288 RepID=UPI0039C5AE63